MGTIILEEGMAGALIRCIHESVESTVENGFYTPADRKEFEEEVKHYGILLDFLYSIPKNAKDTEAVKKLYEWFDSAVADAREVYNK